MCSYKTSFDLLYLLYIFCLDHLLPLVFYCYTTMCIVYLSSDEVYCDKGDFPSLPLPFLFLGLHPS